MWIELPDTGGGSERDEPVKARRPGRRVAMAAYSALIVALGTVLLAASAAQAGPQSAPSREYQIKAAFLLNFGQFVAGFPATPADPNASFVIGVLGDDPFGQALDALVAGRTIHDRPIVVERYDGVDEIGACQILFVSSSESERLEGVFDRLEGRAVLTVGEAPGFAEGRGAIQFVVADNRVRLEINTAAAERAGLTISSRLLRLAEVVHTEVR